MSFNEHDNLAEMAKEFYWYHCVEIGDGIVTDGDYDMNEYLNYYHFPEMTKKKVLDVGRASGFFSFEFEKRGALVTATELESFLDWDFVGGDAEKRRRISEIGDIQSFTRRHITGAFNFAHAARRSKVTPITSRIYDFSPETLGGQFDIVFAGSVASHVRDPILAFERLRSVTCDDGVCIVASPYVEINETFPIAALVGTADSDRRSWWVLNRRGLSEMLRCAGFGRVEIVDSFDLTLRRQIDAPAIFPHIVAHAYV